MTSFITTDFNLQEIYMESSNACIWKLLFHFQFTLCYLQGRNRQRCSTAARVSRRGTTFPGVPASWQRFASPCCQPRRVAGAATTDDTSYDFSRYLVLLIGHMEVSRWDALSSITLVGENFSVRHNAHTARGGNTPHILCIRVSMSN
jgi:hypothetical protein